MKTDPLRTSGSPRSRAIVAMGIASFIASCAPMKAPPATSSAPAPQQAGAESRDAAAAPASGAPAPAPATVPALAMSGRKALKLARAARAAGRFGGALGLYERMLGDPRVVGAARAEALYGAAMIRLLPDPSLRDLAKARGRLEDFRAAYPEDERRLETELALDWIERIDKLAAASARITELEAEIPSREKAFAEQREKLSGEVVACLEQVEGFKQQIAELQPFRSEVSVLKDEVKTLREDLEKKDKALQKVKETLVGKKS